jgi:hypothetical protein
MKKRDMVIFIFLVVLVVIFTAWEVVTKRQREAALESARRAEREQLESRLAAYGLEIDSLSTTVLRIVDSLKTEAAAFESLAVTRLDAAGRPIITHEVDRIPPQEETIPPRDTMQQAIQTEYERALADLPADLTKYEQKVAVKEVENTILAKFNLTTDEFEQMKKTWSAAP